MKKIFIFLTIIFLGINFVNAFSFSFRSIGEAFENFYSTPNPSHTISDGNCYNLNGTCELARGENSETCPGDCKSYCTYDGKCDLSDDEKICVSDCTTCNYNEICEITENNLTCAFDCNDQKVGVDYEDGVCSLSENIISEPACLCQRDYCNVLGAYAECFGTCNDFFGGKAIVKRIKDFKINDVDQEMVVIRLHDSYLSLLTNEESQKLISNNFEIKFPEITDSSTQNIFSAKMKIRLSKKLEENQEIKITFSQSLSTLNISTCENNECCQDANHAYFDGNHNDYHLSIIKTFPVFDESGELVFPFFVEEELCTTSTTGVGQELTIPFTELLENSQGVENSFKIEFMNIAEDDIVEDNIYDEDNIYYEEDYEDNIVESNRIALRGDNVITFKDLIIEVTKPFEDIQPIKILEVPISFGIGLKGNIQTDASSCQITGEQCDTSTTCGCNHYFNEELPDELCNLLRTSKNQVIYNLETNVYHYNPNVVNTINHFGSNYDLKSNTDFDNYAYRISSDSYYRIKTYNIEQQLIASNFITENDEDYLKILDEDGVRLRIG